MGKHHIHITKTPMPAEGKLAVILVEIEEGMTKGYTGERHVLEKYETYEELRNQGKEHENIIREYAFLFADAPRIWNRLYKGRTRVKTSIKATRRHELTS